MKAKVTGGRKANQVLEDIEKRLKNPMSVFVGVPKGGPRYTYTSYKAAGTKGKKRKTTATKTSTQSKKTASTPRPAPLVSEVAFWNEFGTKTIPERSFLRATIKRNAKRYIALERKLLRKVVLGQLDLKKALGIVGVKAEGDVKKAIFRFKSPPNAKSTIKQKGFNDPLSFTSLLAQSIKHEVKKG